MRVPFSVETKVAIALGRSASGVGLEMLGNLHGYAKSTSYKVVLDFCKAIVTSGLRDLYIRWPFPSQLEILATSWNARVVSSGARSCAAVVLKELVQTGCDRCVVSLLYCHPMATEAEYRCFIGGLSWETTDRDLEDAFQPFGNILEAKVVMNRDTGRSKGFGFVTFREAREMQEAIDQMHGMKLGGRPITVDKAQGKTGGNGGGGGGGRGGGGGGGGGDGCFKCGQSGHWARDCPSGGGGGYRGSYNGGRADRDSRSDRYGGGGGSRYGGERNGDRYGSSDRGSDRYGGGRPSSNRDGGNRDRYSSGGPSRSDGGGYRDRSGPYDRESGGKYGGSGGGGHRSSYDDRD
ncbi:hypothetical protein L7F22_014558 [Adiantum nelumboides]|nr:hypothetical protein [Adiantum nelumboides]